MYLEVAGRGRRGGGWEAQDELMMEMSSQTDHLVMYDFVRAG